MSDDSCLGTSCWCLPRRLFVLLFALGHLAYWSFETFHFIILRWLLHSSTLTPQHCSGIACREVVGCNGTFEASMHFYVFVLLVGGVFFGYVGTLGALHCTARDIHWFACFLVAKAAFLLVLAASDGFYFKVCEAYPRQVVNEAILWRLPGVPIDEPTKEQVSSLRAYPVGFLDELSRHGAASSSSASLQIWRWYLAPLFLQVLLWLFVARETWTLADLVAFGPSGLGSNYSLRKWRDDVLLKGDVQAFFVRTKELARANVRELAWQSPVLARPYRHRPPHAGSYGGTVAP